MTRRQAEQVAVVVDFVEAFNRRRLDRALASFTAEAAVSDCDYRRARVVAFTGRRRIAAWLRSRFADRDRLVISRVYDENPSQPIGVAAVEYRRRSNDALRALGFANGIKPEPATKVTFNRTGTVLITGFGNGPVGGSPRFCDPAR